jgi:hypothetical protein
MRRPKGVPRDEWLLAIGLANRGSHRHASPQHGFVHHVAAWIKDAPLDCSGFWGEWIRGEDSDELAAMHGADHVTRHTVYSGHNETDCGNPDAYAAGAALAMALEES